MAKKGFSLFTPLVGTAIVVMTIVVASSIVQNDVRISRSITMSYITSSQGISAKLIKAAIELHMLETIEYETVGAGHHVAGTWSFTCPSGQGVSCTTAMENYIISGTTTPRSSIILLERKLTSADLVSGLFESIVLVSGYAAVDQADSLAKLQNALQHLRNDNRPVATAEWYDSSECNYGKYKVTLLRSEMRRFDEKNPTDAAFSATFKEKNNPDNKLTISIATSVSYITKDCIHDFIKAHEEKFDEVEATSDYTQLVKPKTGKNRWVDSSYLCVDSDDEYFLTTSWELSTGEYLILKYESSNYAGSGTYYELGTVGAITSFSLLCGSAIIPGPGPVVPGPGPVVPAP